jgi:hypothetical protein
MSWTYCGCTVQALLREQESALSMAAEHGHMEIVNWLCDTMRVDVEAAMHRALGVACMGPCGLDPARNVEVARFLLERGAKTSFCSAEQPDREVEDALYCDLINVAAQHGQHLVLLELLLRDYRETTDNSKADALNSALKEAVKEHSKARLRRCARGRFSTTRLSATVREEVV